MIERNVLDYFFSYLGGICSANFGPVFSANFVTKTIKSSFNKLSPIQQGYLHIVAYSVSKVNSYAIFSSYVKLKIPCKIRVFLTTSIDSRNQK